MLKSFKINNHCFSGIWADTPPLEKGAEGDLIKSNATLQQEIFANIQGVLERIWESL
jgi:hypothetical protein